MSKSVLEMPGPGMYENNSPNKSKAFTFSGKTKDRYNQNPGPGAYDAITEHTKDSARTYVMSSEKRTT